MVELTNGHVRSDVLSHRQERDTNHRKRLMRIVLLLRIQMIVTMIQHGLNLEDIPRSGVGAHLDENERLLPEWRLDSLERLDRRFRSILSTCRIIPSAESSPK